jgi:hypothetical protein
VPHPEDQDLIFKSNHLGPKPPVVVLASTYPIEQGDGALVINTERRPYIVNQSAFTAASGLAVSYEEAQRTIARSDQIKRSNSELYEATKRLNETLASSADAAKARAKTEEARLLQEQARADREVANASRRASDAATGEMKAREDAATATAQAAQADQSRALLDARLAELQAEHVATLEDVRSQRDQIASLLRERTQALESLEQNRRAYEEIRSRLLGSLDNANDGVTSANRREQEARARMEQASVTARDIAASAQASDQQRTDAQAAAVAAREAHLETTKALAAARIQVSDIRTQLEAKTKEAADASERETALTAEVATLRSRMSESSRMERDLLSLHGLLDRWTDLAHAAEPGSTARTEASRKAAETLAAIRALAPKWTPGDRTTAILPGK